VQWPAGYPSTVLANGFLFNQQYRGNRAAEFGPSHALKLAVATDKNLSTGGEITDEHPEKEFN
jgi:hypothetical protein